MIESNDTETIKILREETYKILDEVYRLGVARTIKNFTKSELNKLFENYYVRLKEAFYVEINTYKLKPAINKPTLQ